MKPLSGTVLALAVGVSAIALSSNGASAAIACSGDTCWHVHSTYHYPDSARVVVHPEGWHWGPKVVIRDHEGRGYWRDDHWVEFH